MATIGNDVHVLAEPGDIILLVSQPKDPNAELLQTPIPVGSPAPGTVVMRIQALLGDLQRHSSYFRELLQGQKSRTAPAANQIEITDCDPELFLLAMKIVHGKPHDNFSLGLAQLALLASIIDRYKLHGIMQDYTDLQFLLVEGILLTMGEIVIDDLEKWIFICWVLSKRYRLNTAVRMAIRLASYPLSCLTLPGNIIDFIEQHRVRVIAAIQETLNSRLNALSETHSSRCTRSVDCDYQQFGALATLAKVTQLNYPPTQPPFICISVASIFNVVAKFKFPMCPTRTGHGFECPNSGARCQCVFDCEVGPYIAQSLYQIKEQISQITFQP